MLKPLTSVNAAKWRTKVISLILTFKCQIVVEALVSKFGKSLREWLELLRPFEDWNLLPVISKLHLAKGSHFQDMIHWLTVQTVACSFSLKLIICWQDGHGGEQVAQSGMLRSQMIRVCRRASLVKGTQKINKNTADKLERNCQTIAPKWLVQKNQTCLQQYSHVHDFNESFRFVFLFWATAPIVKNLPSYLPAVSIGSVVVIFQQSWAFRGCRSWNWCGMSGEWMERCERCGQIGVFSFPYSCCMIELFTSVVVGTMNPREVEGG